MAKSKFIPIAAMAACLGATPAQAATGNDYLLYCKNPDSNGCMGYTMGVDDGARMTWALAKTDPFYCPPEGVTISQLRDVGLKLMRDRPENNHIAASSPLIYAWAKAWPCKDGAK